MKVMTVFGTRPEAIKMCPVILELKKNVDIDTVVCLTGQHREMLDQVMDVFGILADYDLDIMKEKQTLAEISCNCMRGLDGILEVEKPDVVLVHGDTTSSYIAALTAFYRHIPVGHVEAGLRTYNFDAPFPEEFNRQSVDMISTLYFAPTNVAKLNLIREGKNSDLIFVTGNTVIDALSTTIVDDYNNGILEWIENSRLILLTAHRRENIGEPIKNIFRAIKRVVEKMEDVKVLYPMHKNPQIREIARKILGNEDRIKLVEPLDITDFHNIMKRSYLILTDSGGIQEEASALGIPVIVMRDTTERPEGVDAGTLLLVGTDEEKIVAETMNLLSDIDTYRKMSRAENPYGDGHSSEKIVIALRNHMNNILKDC